MAEPDASKTVKGITKLSLDPVSSTNPIAVGDNDARVNKINAAQYASFSAAVDAAAAVTGTNILQITTNVASASNKTVPSDVILEFDNGGKLSVSAGTVTIQGEIRAPAQQIFNITGSGAVDISAAQAEAFYFEWYGITSGSDNTTAMQRLITARKGTLYGTNDTTVIRLMPQTVYSFASPLSFDETLGIELRGNGGGEVQPSSEIRYTGSGSTSAITLKSAYGFHAEAVSFTYTSETFTGFLFETGQTETAGYGTSAYFSFERCRFEGNDSAYQAAALVSLTNSIISSFTHCRFRYAQKSIKGEEGPSPGPQTISYVVKFDTCTFNDAGIHIYNPAQGWIFINNAFEATFRSGGLGGSYRQGDNRVIDGDAGRYMWNLVLTGNWIGDASPTASTYSAIHLIGAFGAEISGNFISNSANAGSGGLVTAIEMTQSYGVHISGNNILGADRAFSYTTTASFGVVIAGNKLNCTTNVPVSVGGISNTIEVCLGNDSINHLIKGSGLEVNDGYSGTTVSTTTGSITLGGLYAATPDTGPSSAIRVTAGVTGYAHGSIIAQPRTDIAADWGFHTNAGEQFRVLGAGGVKIGGGSAITKILRGTVTVDPASIAANTVATQTFTLTGAATGDNLVLNPPAAGLTAGLLVLQTRVSAANTISITFMNTTGSAIDESSASWSYLIVR